MYRIIKILITFVLSMIYFVLITEFINANGFGDFPLRSKSLIPNEVGFFYSKMAQLEINFENKTFEKKKIIGIYKITSPTNKVYIGRSIDCNQRKIYYKKLSCKSQTKLFYSIKKYGWSNHKFEIIKECNKNELDSLEIYYIKLFKCFNTKGGMNLTNGGGTPSYSEESKKIMSAMRIGKKHTKKTKEKMSKSHKGLNTWNTTHSEKTKKKMSNPIKV